MRIFKLSIVFLLCVFSTLILAASSRSTPMGKPIGFYLGAGVGVASITASHSDVVLQTVVEPQNGFLQQVPLGTYMPVAYKSTVGTLLPMFELGYWGNLSNRSPDWMWGVKAFYKCLNVNVNYQLSNGSSYFDNNHDVNFVHETGLLASLGFRYLQKIYPYVGVGLLWLPKVKDIFRSSDIEPINGGDSVKDRSVIGALFQFGFTYMLTPNWYLDTFYLLGTTGARSFNRAAPGLRYDPIMCRVRVVTQEVMLSINRRFKF